MNTKHLIQLRKGDVFKRAGKILTVLSNPEISDGRIRFDVQEALELSRPFEADVNWKVDLVESSEVV